MNLNEEKDDQVQNPEEQSLELPASETPVENSIIEETAETTLETAEAAIEVVEESVEVVEETTIEIAEVAPEVVEEVAEVDQIAAEVDDSEIGDDEPGDDEPGESDPAQETPAAVEEDEEEVELPLSEPVVAGGAHDDFNWNMDKRGAIA
ncbi:MAG: hypothetical protein ACK4NS_13915, partial [Saprospiraceae bacterium]